MSDTPNLPTYFPMLVTFFIMNEAFHKIQLSWAKFVSAIYICEITLLNIKYHISVQRHIFSLAAESLRTLTTQYTTRVQRASCLQIMFLSAQSNQNLIILDFLRKEIKILKVGFSNFHSISWSYEMINCFVFTWLSR